jgi:hypothetical protein
MLNEQKPSAKEWVWVTELKALLKDLKAVPQVLVDVRFRYGLWLGVTVMTLLYQLLIYQERQFRRELEQRLSPPPVSSSK